MTFSGLITASQVIYTMPFDKVEARVQCDADIDIAFWNPRSETYDPASAVAAPGGFIGVLNARAEITTATTANVIIS